jgi:hypothetical protein
VGDQPAILPAGGVADLALVTSNECSGSRTPPLHALVIGMATGNVTAIVRPSGDFSADAVFCGLSVTTFARWTEGPVRAERGSPLLQLTASGPVNFTPGSSGRPEVNYTITVANPLNQPVALTPCPSYTETLTLDVLTTPIRSVSRLVAARSYALNCSAARSIASHGQVTYAMRLLLPVRLPKSTGGTLIWRLNAFKGTGPEVRSNWCASCN